ncbi:KilA-N domain-containing protein [Acinetobacter sp. CAAS 2-6]|uniref:KilA-N domain-containing protein n=1 Tax=Acinetobacter sp. CAAS 2-6 TaxID=3016358 RepID=UPI002DD6440D|nr:KilA-N domain-containing protein [Acinetobacter sp. CAAS 2-6]
MKGLITSKYDGQELSFNEHGWFNATQAAKHFNKRPNDWLSLDDTKNYSKALCEHLGISEPKSLIKTKRGGNTVTSQNGNAQGTWLHPKLAVAFARWLDVRFGVWCDMQIDQLLRGTHPIFDHRRLRHQAASTYKAVSTILKLSREQQGKDTKPHHYMNESKLINWAITGEFTGLDRDSLSLDELDLLAELEAQDLILIGSQCTYEQRKTALNLFANNYKAKQLLESAA